MDRQQQIEQVCQTIIREFNPDQLILFGSEARGTPRPDSDIDLLVVMPFTGSAVQQSVRLYQSIRNRKIGVDLVVHTPEDVAWRRKEGDFFLNEIFRTGKVIHEGHNA